MNQIEIMENNKKYWDDHADFWFGTTALPEYGVHFVTEEELGFFKDIEGKAALEICCGSGHSLKYLGQRKAKELWGVDISKEQLSNARKLLDDHGIDAKLICAPMEDDLEIPKNHFDYVYSIYGMGWTTDLQGTFDKVASYLKKDGTFIFSWHHTLNYCVAFSQERREEVIEDGRLIVHKSYFDESYFKMPVHDSEIVLCNRKISTYINALAKAGFVVEAMIEENSDADNLKVSMIPISVCFKACKL